MTDADPEHEVRDVVGPHDGVVEAPHADASDDQIADAYAEHAEEPERKGERDIPRRGGALCFVDAANGGGDLAELVHVEDKRSAFAGTVDGVVNNDAVVVGVAVGEIGIVWERRHGCARN